MSSFRNLRIVDNFYQTSAFFPMPTVVISTLNDDGSLNLGSYSLCFPYYIAGKGRYDKDNKKSFHDSGFYVVGKQLQS